MVLVWLLHSCILHYLAHDEMQPLHSLSSTRNNDHAILANVMSEVFIIGINSAL